MVFAYVFVKGWTIDPYLYGIFYESHVVLVLPPHHTEIFQCSGMTRGVKMAIYWGRGHQMFLEPLPKCSSGCSYIFFITFHPVTFKSVNATILLGYRIFVFHCHQEVFHDFTSFEVHLYPMFSANSFDTSFRPFVYGNTI